MSGSRKTTRLDTSFHDRRRAEFMKDPEFKTECERQHRVIAAIDGIVNRLDALRVELGLSKAELARAIDKNPASVRRLLTAKGNPAIATVVAIAEALDADLLVVPRKRSRGRAAATTSDRPSHA